MALLILLLFIQLIKLNAIIPYDGIIYRSDDGSAYAFLSPPETGDHASFIEQMTPSGTLAVAYFTGGIGNPNCSIAVSLLTFGSNRFTPGVIVSERVNYSNQNPVLYWDKDTQILHLYHTTQPAHQPESTSEIWHLQSKDQGVTWSTAEPFYTLPGSFDRNRIIPTLNGTGLIFPCYKSTEDNSTTAPYSFILQLSSGMSIVARADIKESDSLIQPTVVRLPNSSQLRAFFRDKRGEWIYYADSNDDGLTWTTPKPTSLPNNDAGIEAYVLKSGTLIMAFDNLNGRSPTRTPLAVALSYDNGITWPYLRDIQIHDDDNATYAKEYSYPSLLQSFWSDVDGNDIHLVHTYNRLTIKYRRFNEKWVTQGKSIINNYLATSK